MGALPDWELRRFTPDEYLTLELDADTRSEFIDGYIYSMAGATPEHEQIVFNLSGLLFMALDGAGCTGYGSNLMIRGRTDRFIAYPDLTVICGAPLLHAGRRTLVTNPTAIFEVLSSATEPRDRGTKLDRYREIETLQEYLLVSQTEPRIEMFHRTAGEEWAYVVAAGLDAAIRLPSIGATLPLDRIYRGIEFR